MVEGQGDSRMKQLKIPLGGAAFAVLAANRIMDSTIGGEAIAPPSSEKLGHAAGSPVLNGCITWRLRQRRNEDDH